ncbi:sensor histidine kinase [Brenneria tiliae]|uniref:sensor histidine kinase n=1 Tax=Brenneria tiliae TaxID=2914984 RepID=UPI002014F7AB|nr:HAMP domain-containing sensor histidine kinase [Brenneria tiliae]MCL2899685.1 HAMP domain-containing histidine kinase [Brenneria tiliae]MCL2904063.1 HAMP domain-containing histidine kinase [Brenneria tiliae]
MIMEHEMMARWAPQKIFNDFTRSLSFRLWLVSIVVLSVSLVAITMIVLYVFSQSPLELWQMDDNQRTAESVVSGLQFDQSGQPAAVKLDSRTDWLFDVAPTEIMYRVVDERENILLASNADHVLSWGNKSPSDSVGVHQQIMLNHQLYDLFTLKLSRGDRLFYVQTLTSNAFGEVAVDLKLKPIPKIIGVTILIAVIGFGLTFPFTIRWVLRPLKSASQAAMSITPANLRTRLDGKDIPNEIKPLIVAFNDVLERLEKGFIAQQEFLGAAAHELKTPLTLLRAQIELHPDINDKALLLRDIDFMARQVRQLLQLAELSESQNYHFARTDRLAVIQEAIGYLRQKAERRKVELTVRAAEPLSRVDADKSALFILLKNIIDNAINVSPPNGAVIITVTESAFRIQDSGPGIRPDDLPFLFDRFWRGPNASPEASGLGLAICKEIANAHHWKITLQNLARGVAVMIHLPPHTKRN